MFETRQISYIVKGYNDIFGRFTLENRAGEEVILFVEDFDGWRIGDDDVSLAGMLAWLAADAGDNKTNADKLEKVDVVTEDGKEILVVEGSVGDSVETDDAVVVFTKKGLTDALAGTAEVIELGNDIELSDWVVIGRPVKLDGNNKTIFGVENRNGPVLHLNSGDIEIKHVTIKSEEFNSRITAGINIYRGHTGIVIDDVTFENTGYGVYANPDTDVTITNCIFKNLSSGIGIEGKGKIEANEFSKIKNNYVENASTNISTDDIIANNNFDTTPTIDGINIKPAQ